MRSPHPLIRRTSDRRTNPGCTIEEGVFMSVAIESRGCERRSTENRECGFAVDGRVQRCASSISSRVGRWPKAAAVGVILHQDRQRRENLFPARCREKVFPATLCKPTTRSPALASATTQSCCHLGQGSRQRIRTHLPPDLRRYLIQGFESVISVPQDRQRPGSA